METLNSLNPQQVKAVTAGDGAVLVLAGPGSGKTRVLTHRIAYLISNRGIGPYHILAVTFTNKAAREMESRVSELLGGEARGLTLGTFHATCAQILRREAQYLPFKSNFAIFDTDDQLSVVKQVLEDLNLDPKRFSPQGVLNSISNAKNELLLAEDYPVQNYRDEVVKRVYARYQELLLVSNGLDFDDLLLWTARLLEENLEAREKYARRYEHVLVDEFQDTNMAQYLLLKHLAAHHGNIFAVGDIDQSIYAWRGADYRNVQRFERDFPQAEVILLEQNYRSTQSILDVAMAVIDRNPYRTPKRLFTDRGAGEQIVLRETYDDREEAAYVVETIARLVAKREAQPGHIAVMYRTNAQSRLLEEAFLHAGLPYKLVGAQRFYGRKEVKDIVAYLRLVYNPNDEVSLTRVINVPARGIGAKTIEALRLQARQVDSSPGELLLEIGCDSRSAHLQAFPGRAGAAISQFACQVATWRGLAGRLAPLALMDQILEDTGYREYLEDGTEAGQERWENIQELRRVAAEYEKKGLETFLQDVALVSDQDTLDESANAPTLLTLHSAKGLEFPVVFIVGLSDGTLPHSRSIEDPEAMQEERRLFYVGITRAKDRLYLVAPLNRSAYGYSEPVEASRFVSDIPAHLVEHSARFGRRARMAYAQDANRWDSAPAPRLDRSRYPPGARVNHPVWGEGMVLNSRLQDDDEIVDVFFAEVGLKRVSASLAKLEIKSS